MADRVIQRNDTAANWQQYNPVLAQGEIGIITDGAKGYKIGDGVTRWNDLPFPANPANVVQEAGNSENAVMSQKAVTEKLTELGSYVENNPEYARAYTDAEGKFLWGIKQDGSIEWAKGVPTPVKKYIESLDLKNDEEVERINQLVISLLADVKVLTDTYHYVSNSEWACAIVDSEERVLMGIKTDGTFYVPNRDMYHTVSNPEWLKAVVDADNKILFGIKRDGTCYIPKGITENARAGLLELTLRISFFEEIISEQENFEWVQVVTDSEGKVLEGIGNDGKKYFPKQEMLEKYNDPEGRTEITLDADGKILSYRDKKSIKHEEAGLNARFVLSDANKKTLYENLKSLGYNFMDWSNATRLEIDMPKCAYINIICASGWPTTKTQDTLAELEFYDMQGNYFRKYIIFNAQGSSSLLLPKKNASLDLYVTKEDAINDENTFEVKFGNWLAFDSYHIKAYYSDQFKCCNPVCYKLYQQISDTRGIYNDRIWKRALLDFSELGPVPGEEGSVFNSNLIFDEALGHPDGFPCIAYLNGEFYGVYSWQIKKHRDNYKQDKAKVTDIHLDIYQTDNSLWAEPSIKWSFQEAENTRFPIEIRNPKNLYYKELHWVNGKNTLEYDGDYPYEIAGSTEVESWIENEQLPDGTWPSKPKDVTKLITNLRITAQVKDYILTLSDYVREMQAAAAIYEASEKTAEDLAILKATFEERFDKESIIDYIITIDLCGVTDSVTNNVQWLTYDGVKWFASPYDMDRSFRQGGTGGPYNEHVAYGGSYSVNTLSPITLYCKYYEDELDARYKELADKGIASVDGIFSIFKKWINAVGSNNYILDAEKWKEGEITDNMYRLHKFIEEEVSNMDSVYSYTRN